MKPPYKSIARLGSVALLALPATMFAATDYQTTVLSQSPAAYYRLNETVLPPATLPDAINIGSVGAAGNGTYETVSTLRGITPGAIASQPGSAAVRLTAEIDGNRVRIPYQPQWNTAGPFSFEYWTKPGPGNITQCGAANVEFISSPVQRNGWLLYQNSGGSLTSPGWSLRFYNSTGLSAATILDVPSAIDVNAWYHVVGTFDGTTISLYINGTLAGSTTIAGTFRPNTNSAIPLTFGARADGASGYFSSQASFDEAAYYTTVLSPAQVLAHYQAGTNPAPATPYENVILADAPVGYWRMNEPGDTGAANLGTLGSAVDGAFLPGSVNGSPGPVPPAYPGFSATNTTASFTGNGSAVRLPALNLNTNTVTISAWLNAADLQQSGAGIVVTPGSGLIISGFPGGGLGLGYHWNNDPITYNWNPVTLYGFPQLPISDWAFAALVVQPTEANLYIGITNSGSITFVGVTNYFNHLSQSFSAATLIGTYDGAPAFSFFGAIDEVAIWQRSLASGELYTQFASAVGGVPPLILEDLVEPSGPAATGDSVSLSVNAGGTPDLVYTWYKDNTAIAATTNNGTYTIDDVTFGDAGTYEVTVTNSFGSASSQEVTVTVVNPTLPVITSSEGFYTSRVLYPTGTLHLAVSATGGGLKYLWYRNGTLIPSATAASYTVASVTTADAGNYIVVVTNSVGSATNGPTAIVVPTVAPGSYEAAIIASGPTAWWRLDETSGTNMFDGLGRHDGTYTNVSGGPLPTLGVTGALVTNANTAASFGAAGAVGMVPFSPIWNGAPFTVEIWAKAPTVSSGDFGVPISSGDNDVPGWGWANFGGKWAWYHVSADGASTAPTIDIPGDAYSIVPGAWTHLVLVFGASSNPQFPYDFYINGQTDNSTWGWNEPGLTDFGPLIIGGGGFPDLHADAFFNGDLDEVAIYPRAMSQAEIQTHFAARGVQNIPPTFTSHPLPQTVTVGKTVTFRSSAAGLPTPGVQWLKNGTPIAGATSNTFTIPSVTLGDAGSYSLRATNAVGTNVSTAANLAVIPATAYANVTNNLVLHLRFEGNAQDSSGRGNNGTESSSPAPNYVQGQVGAQAAEFTTTEGGATASWVDLGTPADLLFGSATSFTVGMWVKFPTNAAPGDLPFIGTATNAANNPGWFIGPSYEAGGWQWNFDDGSTTAGVEGPDNSINDGLWHSYVVTVDRSGAEVKAYLDGILVSIVPIAGLGSLDGGGAVTVGQDPTHTYPEAATFALDDIGIWRRALTALEVATLESAGKSGNSFDTVGPSTVTLSIAPSGSNLEVNWSPAIGTLLEAPSVTGPWTTNGSAPPYIVGPSNAARFYRVQVQ